MLPTKLRSERCANDLNHFQLKVPSGTFSIAEIPQGYFQSQALAAATCGTEHVQGSVDAAKALVT